LFWFLFWFDGNPTHPLCSLILARLESSFLSDKQADMSQSPVGVAILDCRALKKYAKALS
jgi:hypothetical protein